ncbi:outer membrane lipoprotein LolB [Chitinimonas arctica]|uniref:Outer-membrane lipoprotein LolB n=1 Tax=Chitinimonas arctica TaxID=2594795 RepID=A0A516SE40_9NEIS|nr:lipoprotein insertase outer membrane protein LolB [Chitinimonas arctica]QDQ26437.1 outer membrane lipoprotein LolB [Chitinimonas arctica]
MVRFKWLATVLAGLLLASCATQRPAPAALSQLPAQYHVSGRVAVNAAGKGYNARFSWSHASTLDTVDISNPLGQVLARLELDGDDARFFDGSGKLRAADDIEALSERELGWRLPASGLRFWLLGLADPGRPAIWTKLSDANQLEQDGWTIRYPLETAGTAPTRLTLSRPDLEVRIALYDWQLASSTP